ncbi:MAG: hypothetical protein ACRCZF_23585 [Gemmataceae bacterium]
MFGYVRPEGVPICDCENSWMCEPGERGGVCRQGHCKESEKLKLEHLRTIWKRAREILHEIDKGAGLCEDHHIDWKVELENECGRDKLEAMFRDNPEFGQRMPELAKLLEENIAIGIGPGGQYYYRTIEAGDRWFGETSGQ